MLIEYVTNRSRRTVTSRLGDVLIARGIAREVVEPKKAEPKSKPEPMALNAEDAKQVETTEYSDDEVLSPRTGKPKRRYKRRDMQAED